MGEDRFSRRDAIGGRLLGGLLKSFGATARDVREGVLGPQRSGAPSLPSLPVLLRPPGAIEESAFVTECTKCDACVRACPVDAITHAESFFGAAGGTPVIDPSAAACTMCEERACVVACEAEGPGVLSSLLDPRMGVARIHPSRCVVYHGEECQACFDACPVEGALLEMGRQPTVDALVCVGCGMCVQACPVEPCAVSIVPTSARPPKPAPSADSRAR